MYRHSNATNAEVNMDFNDGKTMVSISDNGKGSDIPKMIGDLARTGKLGLTGMQEQTRLIGGNLIVNSRPGEGTRVTVEVPV